MLKKNANHEREAIMKQLQDANNSITDEQASEIFDILDAVHILLSIPKGQRININKSM